MPSQLRKNHGHEGDAQRRLVPLETEIQSHVHFSQSTTRALVTRSVRPMRFQLKPILLLVGIILSVLNASSVSAASVESAESVRVKGVYIEVFSVIVRLFCLT